VFNPGLAALPFSFAPLNIPPNIFLDLSLTSACIAAWFLVFLVSVTYVYYYLVNSYMEYIIGKVASLSGDEYGNLEMNDINIAFAC